MSNQSTPTDPSPGHQPRDVARVSGNRIPRHVQWASAVVDEEDTGRLCDRDLESQRASNSTHELDEAGLDVCEVRVPYMLSVSLGSSVNSLPPSKRSPMHSNVIVQTPHHLFRPSLHPDRPGRLCHI